MSIKEEFLALDATKIAQARKLEMDEKAKREAADEQQNVVMARIKSLLGGGDAIDLSLFDDDEIELLESVEDFSELSIDESGHLVRAPKNMTPVQSENKDEEIAEQKEQLSAIRQALARTRTSKTVVDYNRDDKMEIIRVENQSATEARAYISTMQISNLVVCAVVGNEGFGTSRSVWAHCETGENLEELICRIGYTLVGRYSSVGFISKLTVYAPTMAAFTLAQYVWSGLMDYEAESNPVKSAFAAMVAQAKLAGLDIDIIPSACPTEHGQMIADSLARDAMANLTSYHVVSEAENVERLVASVTQEGRNKGDNS